MPSERSGSSIPIPEPALDALSNVILGWELRDAEGDPVVDSPILDRLVDQLAEAAAPKLYEAWAESRVEAVARALAAADDDVAEASASLATALKRREGSETDR